MFAEIYQRIVLCFLGAILVPTRYVRLRESRRTDWAVWCTVRDYRSVRSNMDCCRETVRETHRAPPGGSFTLGIAERVNHFRHLRHNMEFVVERGWHVPYLTFLLAFRENERSSGEGLSSSPPLPHPRYPEAIPPSRLWNALLFRRTHHRPRPPTLPPKDVGLG